MAVDVSLLNSNSLNNIQENFERVEAALQDAVSRSGIIPNEMTADLDMNSNDILNIRSIEVDSLIVDGEVVQVNVDTYTPADNSVSTIKIQNNAVTDDKIANNSITNDKMADNSVGTNELINASVTSDKIDPSVLSTFGYKEFETVDDLIADTTLDYSSGDRVVSEGDIVYAGGFRYIVQDSALAVITSVFLTGYHLITAGGVKLKVDRVRDAGFNVRAFNAKGDYVDDTTAFQRALWALKPGGGGTLYVPNGGYYITTTLRPPTDCAGIRIIGEGYRATLIAWNSGTAGDLFSWNSDLDHVIMENLSLGNLGNCNRLMVIACVRSTFRNVWLRPTIKVNTALVAATTGVTTYDLSFEDCHFESVSQAQLNAIGLDIPRGHTLNLRNCFFSGIRFQVKLGSASESIDGVNIVGCRFEASSGQSSDRPGASDCICIDDINVRGLNISGCNFELAADTHATSTGHRALVLREKAQGGGITNCFIIGHGIAQGAVEVNHASAFFSARGNNFNAINGYGIVASAGTTSQVAVTSGHNWATGGTTGVAA